MAELPNIDDRSESTIRCVVPFVDIKPRQLRCAAQFVIHLPQLWIREIRKADDAKPTDAGDLAQDAFGVVDALQGLREHYHVEMPIAKAGQPAVEVSMDDVQSAAYARENGLLVHLDAHHAGVAPGDEFGHQLAAATSQVQHAAVERNLVHQDSEVHAVALKKCAG